MHLIVINENEDIFERGQGSIYGLVESVNKGELCSYIKISKLKEIRK